MIQPDPEFRDDCAKMAFNTMMAVAASMSAQTGGGRINMTVVATEAYRAAQAMLDVRNEKLDIKPTNGVDSPV